MKNQLCHLSQVTSLILITSLYGHKKGEKNAHVKLLRN